MGHSIGRFEGSTLVVDTTHVAASTITNNGLDHGENVHFVERFWLSADGKTLMARQEFEDPDTIENRGARTWPGIASRASTSTRTSATRPSC